MARRTRRVAHGMPRAIRKELGAISANVEHPIADGDLIGLSLSANRTLTISDVQDGDRIIIEAVSTCCGTLTIQVQGKGSSATAVVDIYDADACTSTGFTVCDTNVIFVDVWDAAAGVAYARYLID